MISIIYVPYLFCGHQHNNTYDQKQLVRFFCIKNHGLFFTFYFETTLPTEYKLKFHTPNAYIEAQFDYNDGTI